MKAKISRDLKRRWPELSNVLNPGSISLITDRKVEFIEAVESHPDYDEYRALSSPDVNATTKRRVRYERFLRIVDNVIFAENLRRENRTQLLQQYEAIVAAERGTLFER